MSKYEADLEIFLDDYIKSYGLNSFLSVVDKINSNSKTDNNILNIDRKCSLCKSNLKVFRSSNNSLFLLKCGDCHNESILYTGIARSINHRKHERYKIFLIGTIRSFDKNEMQRAINLGLMRERIELKSRDAFEIYIFRECSSSLKYKFTNLTINYSCLKTVYNESAENLVSQFSEELSISKDSCLYNISDECDSDV